VVLALLLIAAAAPLALVTDTGEVVEGLAWLLLPGALAFAVLRRRLWDLDLRRRFDRLRLVREEERSRLQRDLHDSLGPLLGSIAMRVEAAHNLVASGADRADVEPVLQAVAADTESASIEIRRILQELGPSALAERDLTSALQEMVERHPGAPRVTLVLPHVLPRLDPASEIAAYRIVSEALLNVVRHADAEHCRVTVTVVGRDLVLEVRDDGSGLAGATAGVGRRAMADRAAAVGGTLQVADSADGGVVVSAVLPEAAR
jgi:signal transduction histidine kinase